MPDHGAGYLQPANVVSRQVSLKQPLLRVRDHVLDNTVHLVQGSNPLSALPSGEEGSLQRQYRAGTIGDKGRPRRGGSGVSASLPGTPLPQKV